ncbi:MAG: hypothetical protein IJM65_01065 [Bacteroidales bacterium]|nr:hypothetical protein [Bacteroidales bacterium]
MKNSIFKSGWFLLFAAGLLAVMSACKKENTTSELRAVMNDFANSRQKAYIDPEQYNCFVVNETVRVNNSTGVITALERSDRQCVIDEVPVNSGSNYNAFYPAKLLASQTVGLSSGLNGVAVNFPQTQVCTRDANGNQIIDNPMIAQLSGFDAENNYTLHFNNVCALLKLTMCTQSAFDAIHVTFGNNNSNHYKLWGPGEISGGKVVMNGNGNDKRTVILELPAGHYGSPAGEAFYIMIPEVQLSNNEEITVEFMNGSSLVKKYTMHTGSAVTLEYNKIHTLGVFTYNAKVFSVSSTNKVIFAPGNLQWSYTNGGTTPTKHSINGTGYDKGTWRFAPHQYDFIGNGNTNAIGTYIPLSEYIHEYSIDYGGFTDEGYTGWIDLFAWGGSGNGNSRPYFYSYNYGDYYCTANSLGAYDWGTFNTIYNPKTKVNDPYRTWRVLSKEEWDYLLNINGSNDVNVGRNKNWWRCSNISFPVGSETIRGLLIYPDEFSSKPSGVQSDLYPMSTATTQCYPITYNEFVLLENLGCAFIPTSGWLAWSGSAKPTPHLEEHWGCYWTSTHGSDQNAYFLKVNGTGGNPLTAEVAIPYLGYSVRLVRDVR